jgi:hypothetical protein
VFAHFVQARRQPHVRRDQGPDVPTFDVAQLKLIPPVDAEQTSQDKDAVPDPLRRR